MTVVSSAVARLHKEYLALDTNDRARFLQLVSLDPKPTARWPEKQHGPLMLYERLHHHALSLRGHRFPEEGWRQKPVMAELKAAWTWLTNEGEDVDRMTAVGLADIAGEAAAREIRQFDNRNLAQYVRGIPRAVDRAYPAYRANNILLAFANRVGKGQLPIIPNQED